jgi:hypothetical protein
MDIIIPAAIGSGLGTLIVSFLKSYFSEKGKNLATKEDISVITEKVGSIKDEYSRSIESYRSELKKIYDISKPSLELTIEIDKKFIDKMANLNNTVFNVARLEKLDQFKELFDELIDLTEFIMRYHTRYKMLNGIKELVEVHNEFAIMINKGLGIKYNDETIALIEKLKNSLNVILGYFLVPLTNNR